MHVLLTGATGFLGRPLVLRLMRDGHELTAWVRDEGAARDALGPEVALVPVGDPESVRAADAIVNLAGAPIAGKRWTAKRKRELTSSRLDTTRAIVAALDSRKRRVLVSASASGYYGDRGDARLAETALPGEGFAAELCQQWELAAREANATVAIARFGIVLGREGGALAKLLPLARAGLAGPIAGGAQWVPWVHLDDAVEAIVHLLAHPVPVANVVSPAPVRQRDFATAIAHAVHRPAIAPAPRLAMRAILGESASVLTASQRVMPDALLAAGFRFRFASLDAALADIVRAPTVEFQRLTELPDADYTRARRPRYQLIARSELAAPIEQVFPFFAAAENLQLLTPPAMRFHIESPRPIAMRAQAVIDYSLAILGVPAKWRTVIEKWQPPKGDEALFVDAQTRGPYRAWWHEHHFHGEGDKTVMEDVVSYAPPLGPLGAIANRLLVERQLRRIFGYRAAMIRQRFGSVSPSHARSQE